MSEIVSSLCVLIKGSQMYSSQECEENPELLEEEIINLKDVKKGILKTKIRKTKPCILKINLTDNMLPKVRDYKLFVEKCIEIAKANNGIAHTATFPWENNSKYKYGDIIVLDE